MKKNLHIVITFTLFCICSSNLYAQSDWNTYPVRTIAEIIDAHSAESSPKSDMIISAQPFPSKTMATYTGEHRPISDYTKTFIKLWVETRNVPAENANMLVEEYLFKEKEKEIWIPVIKTLIPFIDKELKGGDNIVIYYFFLGGFNPKTLREKDLSKPKTNEVIEDKIKWIFAVEEFKKLSPSDSSQQTSNNSDYTNQTLAVAIDSKLEKSTDKSEFFTDPRQVKSKSKVIFTGEVRTVGGSKLRFLKNWLGNIGLPLQVIGLLQEEAHFREGEKDYWLPVRKTILENMRKQLLKNDTIIINTILAGGIKQKNSMEWVFVVGDFTK